MARAKRPPTDFELLKAIYAKHRGDYIAYAEGARAAKIMVPIDIPSIANELDADADSVFGRLYHHLDPQYAQEPDPTVGRRGRKSFFTLKAGDDANCINLPLLEAVLAGLWQQRRRDLFAVVASVVSLAIATTALGVAIFSAAG